MKTDTKNIKLAHMNAEERFNQLGLRLPPAPTPLGVYKPYLIDGKYLYLSGHGPVREDKTLIIGRIGSELTIEEGKLAAFNENGDNTKKQNETAKVSIALSN